MFICQLGMNKSVQDHTNANVCKQTYDASCSINTVDPGFRIQMTLVGFRVIVDGKKRSLIINLMHHTLKALSVKHPTSIARFDSGGYDNSGPQRHTLPYFSQPSKQYHDNFYTTTFYTAHTLSISHT